MGSIIRYGEVTVLHEEIAANGKTVYIYHGQTPPTETRSFSLDVILDHRNTLVRRKED